MPAGKYQLLIALQDTEDSMSVLSRLLQWVENMLEATRRKNCRIDSVNRLDRLRLPVFCFKNKESSTRMQENKIWMAV